MNIVIKATIIIVIIYAVLIYVDLKAAKKI